MNPKALIRGLAAAGVIGLAGIGTAQVGALMARHADAASLPSLSSTVTATPAAAAATSTMIALPNFTSLVDQYGPAVVNITVTQKAHRASLQEPDESGDAGSDDDPMTQFLRRFPGMLPRGGNGGNEAPSRGLGSGFIVSPDGIILTNAHVVDGASEVIVRLTDKREFRAKVVGSDKRSDVAVLRIDARNLPTVKLGSVTNAHVGEWVVAIGSPYGLDNTVTSGIISAKARALPDENYVPFIQTDAPVNPGNSGGPLFNMNGEVIGINSQIYTRTGGYQGLSFAVPIDIAVKVKDALLASGHVTRGRIGATVQDVNQALANAFGLPRPEGALVGEVEADGPAAKAGIKSGDVIVKLNGKTVERSVDLPGMVADLKPGSDAKLELWRQGKPLDLTVRIAELSDGGKTAAIQGGETHGRLGLAVRPLDPRERSVLGADSGLVVEGATGPAAQAGIQTGDVILSFNGTPVRSVEQLRTLVTKAGKSAAILVQRAGGKIFVPVELG